MFVKSCLKRPVIVISFIGFVLVFALVGKLRFVTQAETAPQSAMLVPTITATNVDALFTDVDGDGRADPGDTLEYTVVINNSGTDATAMQFNETLDANTTFVGSSVNTSPIANNDTYPVTGNVSISVTDGGSDLLGNDIDPDTLNNTGLTASGGTTSAQGGNVVINANGSFTYNPPPGFEGADTFTYTVTDASGATGTGTVTLNVSGMVWFINNNSAACTTLAAGCGRLANPFSTLAAFVALNNGAGNNPATNDNIFVFESATAYTGGIGLITGQKLIGQDANATLAVITGITLPSFSTAFPTMNTGGNATTIQGGAGTGVGLNTVNGTNTVRGLSIGTSVPALFGSNFGTLTLDDVSINNNGTAVNLSGGTANTLFDNITSTGGTIGVTLTNVGGTTNLGTGAISGATSNGLRIDQGTAVVTYAGTITAPGGARPVEVSNKTGGSVTLSGLVSSAGTTFGVLLTGNSSPISFTGGLTLNTGGNPGFTATSNTGVITTTSGTITTGIGTAINIVGTSAASTTPLNMQLTSVSASGGANGIILQNTSGTGFTVVGDGTNTTRGGNGTGGTISNMSGANGAVAGSGVYLDNASGVTLRRMTINGTNQNFGIRGISVTTFNLEYSTVSGTNGNDTPSREGSVIFDNVFGSGNLINESIISGAIEDNLRVENSSGTLTSFNITNNNIQNNSTVSGNIGVRFASKTTGIMTGTISNNSFTGNRTDTINCDAGDSSTLNITVTSNTIVAGTGGNNQGNLGINVTKAIT